MEKEFVLAGNGDKKEAFETGSVRDSRDGKGRFDLIPTEPIRRLAKIYESGGRRYGDHNWKKGQPLQRYIDSALRHINCLVAGEPTEDHAAQACWNLFSYMWTLTAIQAGQLPKSLDDRPPPEPKFMPKAEPVKAKALGRDVGPRRSHGSSRRQTRQPAGPVTT